MTATDTTVDDGTSGELARSMVPSLRRLAPQVLIAGVLPIVAYGVLRPHVSSDAVALAAVMVFPLGELAYERIRQGHLEPIGIISLDFIAGLWRLRRLCPIARPRDGVRHATAGA